MNSDINTLPQARNIQPSIRVLVIDDEPNVLSTINLCLRACGWSIECISDPRLGLATAQSLMPNVILCDASMPHISGVELIQLLKGDPTTQSIPIILMTGDADLNKFDGVPYRTIISKPFQVKSLRESIRHAVSD